MGLFSIARSVKSKVSSYISSKRSTPSSTSPTNTITSTPSSPPSTSPHATTAGSPNITSRPANNTNNVNTGGPIKGDLEERRIRTQVVDPNHPVPYDGKHNRGTTRPSSERVYSPTPSTSPHATTAGSPNITSRPASDIHARRASLSETINAAASSYQPEHTPEEERVIGQMVGGGSETLMYNPNKRAEIIEDIKEKDQFATTDAMRLGAAEPHAQKYEGGVARTLSPLIDSNVGPVRALGGLAESVAYIPTAIPRLAVGLVRNPAATVQGATEGIADNVVTDPWRGSGQIIGMVTGPKVIGKAVKRGPSVKKATLVNIEGGGSNPTMQPINYGWSLNVANRPILTHVTGKGFTKGAGAAPVEILQGKTVTAYSARETALFKETVSDVGGPVEAAYFNAGHEIAGGIYRGKKPITTPDTFKIKSQDVPDAAKPFVEETIRNYPGEIEVYGSASQKLQMGDYMTRSPKDIEVVVDSPSNFVSMLETRLKGTDVKYNIKGADSGKPKVEFITNEGPVKGIEIFGKDQPQPTGTGYIPKTDIAYGFKSQKPINVDGVSLMRLSEQGPRKLAGGNILKDGKIEPVHPGRMKDVGDLVEIGAAYEIEHGIGIKNSLITYSEIAKQKGASSPVVDFIAKNRRTPSKSEFVDIANNPADVIRSNVPDLLYQSGGKSSPSPSPFGSPLGSSFRSPLPSSLMISPQPSSFRSSSPSSPSPLVSSPQSSIMSPPPSSIISPPPSSIISPPPSSFRSPPPSSPSPLMSSLPSSFRSPPPSSLMVSLPPSSSKVPSTLPHLFDIQKSKDRDSDILTGSRKKTHRVADPLDFLMG